MGKCIVCAKSAGPFYSLHKACYQAYEDTRQCLRQVFSKSIETTLQEDEFVELLNDCRPSASFSLRLFEDLVKRAWQDQAKQIIKSKSLNAGHANYLRDLATTLEIEDKDVEPHLFQRLANVEYLVCIDQRQPIAKIFTEIQVEFDLVDDESIIWVFEEATKVEQQRFSSDKQWTVFQSIINSLFNKPRYKELAVTAEATGRLAITNQNLYYLTEKEMTKIGFSDIYSITPMKDGVRIQTTQKDTTSKTYITGDGRFAYALLRYAQEQ